MIEVFQTIWAESRYAVRARDKVIYEEILPLMKSKNFNDAYPLIQKVMNSNEYEKDILDNYKEAALEIWGSFKNKERDNSHFFATLNNQSENIRLLWKLNLKYNLVYLLNSRIFFESPQWNKAWVIKSNKIRLFFWDKDKYYRIRLEDELLEKVRSTQNLDLYSSVEREILKKALLLIHVSNSNVIFNPKIVLSLKSGLELE